jgi:hypothetical protein
MSEANKATARRFYDEFLNKGTHRSLMPCVHPTSLFMLHRLRQESPLVLKD